MEPHQATGALFYLPAGAETQDDLRYRGTTFAYMTPTHFLTAAHCAAELPAEPEQLLIVTAHQAAKVNPGALKVRSVVKHPTADLALLAVYEFSFQRPEGLDVNLGVEPFMAIENRFLGGQQVSALGFPMSPREEFRLATTEVPTVRLLTGWTQRHFDFELHGYRYAAAELSMSLPRGISGAPVFVPQPPFSLVGLATQDVESWSQIASYVKEDGKTKVEEHRVISYGTALRLGPLTDWLEEQISATS